MSDAPTQDSQTDDIPEEICRRAVIRSSAQVNEDLIESVRDVLGEESLDDGEVVEEAMEFFLEEHSESLQKDVQLTDGGVCWSEVSGFQRDLLKAAIKTDRSDLRPSGQNIKRQLEDRYNIEINHGRLYPNFDKLVEMSLLDKGDLDQRTKSYRPTQMATELVRRELQIDVDLFQEPRQ